MSEKIMRKIIKIDSDLCDGCGVCAKACHEGAIAVIGGKAKLVKDSYCDGLGDCIKGCPRDAISFETRETDDYDKAATKAHTAKLSAGQTGEDEPFDRCPNTMARTLGADRYINELIRTQPVQAMPAMPLPALRNWPVQMKLIPDDAPYLKNAALLVAADCSAFSCPTFHSEILPGKVCMVACPKLDDTEPYTEKLAGIIKKKGIRSIEVLYMEVPCCNALLNLVRAAIIKSGVPIPMKRTRLSLEGVIIECEWL